MGGKVVLLKPTSSPGGSIHAPHALETHVFTDELIFGIVGYQGSGTSVTAIQLQYLLHKEYNYDVRIVKATDLIKQSITPDRARGLEVLVGSARADALQSYGNKLREDFGSDYLAQKFVEFRHVTRDGYKGLDGTETISTRVAHIFDSLKYPAEIQLLQDVYGDMYYTVGLFSHRDVLESRLKRKYNIRESSTPQAKTAIIQLINRDADENVDSGQRVQDALLLSDYFIKNDFDSEDKLRDPIARFLNIIFGDALVTENPDESGMALAYSASHRSACLSRQVGASLISNFNELISIGWNDVPRFGGGLYNSKSTPDNRCFNWQNKICHKDHENRSLGRNICEFLRENGFLREGINVEHFTSEILKTQLRDLIEFSRSIHAEMEAILAAARSGKPGIIGSTLYSTTYPCHNCARHIVAAGIHRVVYIEPYPKSAAFHLHEDSIGRDGRNGKVVMHIYEGAHPRNMIRFFRAEKERKNNGEFIIKRGGTASPTRRGALRNFFEREGAIARRLSNLQVPEGVS